MRSTFRILLPFIALLTGCSAADMLPGRSQAPHYARQAGWSWGTIDTGTFYLASALSPAIPGNRPLAVYIEGDGRAFVGSRTPSSDPTPDTPYALRLALAHRGPAAYIARPCQFTTPSTTRGCQVAYWTSHRYAPEVIDSFGQALDRLKQQSGTDKIILVGYSGGGAVAALLAERRQDVVGLVTVSANLDLGYWVRSDGLMPLIGSLDPADEAGRLHQLPQVHFAGRDDDVVRPDVARSFLARVNAPTVASLIEMPGFDHRCCWLTTWRDLVQRPEFAKIPGWNSK